MTTAREYQEKRWLALVLLSAAQFVVVLDASIVNVALPSIGEALDFSQENLPWVVNAYVLTFGGFLLLGGRTAGARDRAPDPERLVALGAVLEGRRDDREGGGGEDRGAEALHGAGGDQLPLAGSQPPEEGGDREEHQPEHEHPAPSQQVGEASAQQQEPAEGEDVGIDHPGEVLL